MNESVTTFKGRNFLVVEDETVIFFLIEEMLNELGAAVVWRASNVVDALALLSSHRPDAAVLDIHLSKELVFPVAVRLEEEKIPFIFTTGYGRALIPSYWSSRQTLQKPFQPELLVAALTLALVS
jgi:CheY-like chemotaxis protein